jgi:Tfp pilus assembly protein PilF
VLLPPFLSFLPQDVELMKKQWPAILLLALCLLFLASVVETRIEAAKVQPNQFHFYLKNGVEKSFNLETTSAIASLKKAVALEPENPTGYAYLAMLHLFSYEMSYDLETQKKDQEAIVRYVSETLLRGEKRVAMNPKDSEAYLSMALAKIAKVHWAIHEKRYLVMAQETSNIWNYLEKAKEADPNNYDIYFLMGLLHYHIDQLPGLTRFVSSLLITSGDNQKGLKEIELAGQKGDLLRDIALSELYSVYLNFEKQPVRALLFARELKEKFPNNYNFLFALGNTLSDLHRFEEAFNIARQIKKNIQAGKPPYVPQLQPRYNQLMGRIFFNQGEYDQATQYFQEALKDTAFYNTRVRVWTLVRLGMIQDIRRDRARAEEYYSKALEIENGEGTAHVEAKNYLKTPYVPSSKS